MILVVGVLGVIAVRLAGRTGLAKALGFTLVAIVVGLIGLVLIGVLFGD